MAGLVLPCAGHPRGAAINLSPAQTFVRSGAYDEAPVFSWMAGLNPATTEKQNPNPTTPNALGAHLKFGLLEALAQILWDHDRNNFDFCVEMVKERLARRDEP
jgi:hypothetical protein